MSKLNDLGTKGEDIACEFLINKGYFIIERNFRAEKKEIDIIAYNGNSLVFVEVKTRYGRRSGFPEEAVTPRKQAHIKIAAERYLMCHPEYTRYRIDVISIITEAGSPIEITHFEDAFC